MYVLKSCFFNFPSKFFDNYCYNICVLLNHILNLHIAPLQYLYSTPQVSLFFSSCSYLHLFLWISLARFLTRFDNELAINLGLSMNSTLWDYFFCNFFSIFLVLVTYFCIRNKRFMCFSVLSPKQVNCFSNSSANSFMIK